MVLTLLLLTPLFHYLPKGVLAAIIMTAVFGLIDVKEAKHLWHVSRPDLALMALTFAATLTLGIEPGILLGVAASLAWFIWQTSRPHVAVLGQLPGSTVYRNVDRYPDATRPPGVLAIRIDAPLYFANTAFLKTLINTHISAAPSDTRHLILDAKGIGSIDAQALSTLDEILDELRDVDIQLWLAGVRGPVRDALKASGFTQRLGSDHVVERVCEAVDQICADPATAPRYCA